MEFLFVVSYLSPLVEHIFCEEVDFVSDDVESLVIFLDDVA